VIAVTFDRYGHLFRDDMDRLAEAMDDVFRGSFAASVRPGRGLSTIAEQKEMKETAV
jgi:hypothetical protein